MPLFANSFATVAAICDGGNKARWKVQACSETDNVQRPTTFGFAVAPRDERAPHGTLPALIATLSLGLSIAVVLTAVTFSAARAAQLF